MSIIDWLENFKKGMVRIAQAFTQYFVTTEYFDRYRHTKRMSFKKSNRRITPKRTKGRRRKGGYPIKRN